MQSIGFLGPAVALIGLNGAQNPSIASAWLTAAVGFTAFSQAGFLVNLQVGFESIKIEDYYLYYILFLYVSRSKF